DRRVHHEGRETRSRREENLPGRTQRTQRRREEDAPRRTRRRREKSSPRRHGDTERKGEGFTAGDAGRTGTHRRGRGEEKAHHGGTEGTEKETERPGRKNSPFWTQRGRGVVPCWTARRLRVRAPRANASTRGRDETWRSGAPAAKIDRELRSSLGDGRELVSEGTTGDHRGKDRRAAFGNANGNRHAERSARSRVLRFRPARRPCDRSTRGCLPREL